MEQYKKTKRIRVNSDLKKIETSCSPAGLARSHKLIRVERDMEIQFNKLCGQIRLNEYKNIRSERQREERISKRHVA